MNDQKDNKKNSQQKKFIKEGLKCKKKSSSAAAVRKKNHLTLVTELKPYERERERERERAGCGFGVGGG